ncbi:dephospho-CoA kinase [Chryseobacterium sp. POL2]|nr:dephospho-CoA kinase [Chryseobacterium sp. POL2]QIG90989.1 dephospho-CoA kinase [Chryseobacterium sp. POL2]
MEEKRKAKLIGITGGIGSGKSSVARMIQERGYPVFYSDDRAKNIVNEDLILMQNIKNLLGEKAYQDGEYNRKYVADLVFNDSKLLEQLNHLIHPAVALDFENWTNAQDSEFIFKETALLFELGLNKDCFKSLLVTADDNTRIKRVMDRDGKTYREVEKVIEKQMSEREKIKKADFVIYNNSDFDDLAIATNEFLEKLISV